MSENIPESVPTSSDPRSRRPTKRRALSPRSKQATHLNALFANPDKPIQLPSTAAASSSSARNNPAPPEIVANVQGSSAGAGSGEFHVYKASRRREYDRLRVMEEEKEKEDKDGEFERQRLQREEADRIKTERNRAKREKAKARKGRAASGTPVDAKKAKLGANHVVPKDGTKGDGEKDGVEAQVLPDEEVGITIVDED